MSTHSPAPAVASFARRGLIILTLINLFNYLDRYIVSALAESLRLSLHLSDAQLGAVMTAFLISFTLTAPLLGGLGDRAPRPRVIAIAVAIWSIATALSGFAGGFLALLAARAAVGIGEAAYGTIGPALIADYFPLAIRGRVFSVFFAAIPIGSAAGYVLGGLVDQRFGWRAAFFIAGAPGLILAILALTLVDPPRGATDAHASDPATSRNSWRTYLMLLRNRPYRLTVLGYAAYTFALGGLAFWTPAFLERMRGLPKQQATAGFGAIVVITGFIGTFLGGWLGDRLLIRHKQAYLWLSGLSTLAAAPIAVIAFTARSPIIYFSAFVVIEILLFMSTGPVNSAIVGHVGAHERARAVGLSIFVIHTLGDVPSPPLMGALSDRTTLATAFLIVPVAIAVAGAIWTWAAWTADRELQPQR
ncbi:MAG TPA: MFS transporter [Thermoanaerobaculia bacterium]|nr:MFS transporter [Thermoanaerobaculia bacterium]